MRTGRPTRMTRLFDVREVDGRRVERTIGEALIDLIRLGHFMETACAIVGINSDTAREWIRTGRRALERQQTGARRRDLTAHERRCSDFSVAVTQALGLAEDVDWRRLGALARGGIPVETVVEVHELDDDGQERLVKRTVRRTSTLPDGPTLRWRLERRFPDRWGRKVDVDLDLEVHGDDEEWGEDPVEEMRRILDGRGRRHDEGMAALETIDAADLLDAEIVDETDLPPDGS